MSAQLLAIDPEPVGADVVAYLEKLLERAKAGRYSAVACAMVNRDGTTGSGWSELPSIPLMIGAVCGLRARLEQGMID